MGSAQVDVIGAHEPIIVHCGSGTVTDGSRRKAIYQFLVSKAGKSGPGDPDLHNRKESSMNVRLIRNTLLAGALIAATTLMPTQKAEALSQCDINCYTYYGECITVGGGQVMCGQWLQQCLASCGDQ